MKFRLVLLATFLVLAAISASAQTADELTAKYGSPVELFEVRSGILMSVKYTADRQVCEMTLDRRHTTDAGINLASSLSDELVRELIDELAPVVERGERKDKAYGKDKYYLESTIGGNIIDTKYKYENVTIRVVGSFSPTGEGGESRVLIIKHNHKLCK